LEDAPLPAGHTIECAATLAAGWVVGQVCASYHREMRDEALARSIFMAATVSAVAARTSTSTRAH
jgi:hypothetical protein